MQKKVLYVIAVPVILIVTFIVLYVNMNQCDEFKQTTKSMDNRMKNINGFGGGVLISSPKRKHFVTMVQKHMFTLNDEGYIPMLNTTKRVWIDVGANSNSFLGSSKVNSGKYWPERSTKTLKAEFTTSDDLFVIAIEPNIIHYGTLLKIPRLVPIVAAIFVEEGTRLFNEYNSDGCSSLLEPNANLHARFSSLSWYKPCHVVKRMTGISTIRLETVLSMIDPCLTIELLKVDAQGDDLDVVKSGGEQLKRVEKIIVETQIEIKDDKTSNLLYKNANTADNTRKWMNDNGFVLDEQQSDVENIVIAEYNYVFNNRNAKKKRHKRFPLVLEGRPVQS